MNNIAFVFFFYYNNYGDDMKNNKGFTLVELLASISILAVICLIAVPSVINLTNKNKKSTYVNDAKRFISLVQYESRKNSYIKDGVSLVPPSDDYSQASGGISLDNIDHADVTTSPEGEAYAGTVFKYNNEFYVCLTDGKRTVYGSLDDLNGDEAIRTVQDSYFNCENSDDLYNKVAN